MTTFDLTENELRAAIVLVQECLGNMGGSRPISLESDPFTWCDTYDLINAGWSKHEAAGTWGALLAKGIVSGETARPGEPCESFLTDDGWRWLDTQWDTVKH